MSKPCFKREVCAVIMDRNGKIAVGENRIYNDDVDICPRLKGENYEKCTSVCKQKGHAEIMAIKDAKDKELELEGSILYLMGHYRICDNCESACKEVGINNIIILGDE